MCGDGGVEHMKCVGEMVLDRIGYGVSCSRGGGGVRSCGSPVGRVVGDLFVEKGGRKGSGRWVSCETHNTNSNTV